MVSGLVNRVLGWILINHIRSNAQIPFWVRNRWNSRF
jgi:hypothetical protein